MSKTNESLWANINAKKKRGEKSSHKNSKAYKKAVTAGNKLKKSKVKEVVLEVLKENFKDGKKKGKSKPGRVKKSGASCKPSITDLKKRVSKASGERKKMYQWCLNMKRGRKKKK